MDYDELKEAVFSIIKDDDPYKVSKQLQVKNWYSAFSGLFGACGRTKLPFFLGVLSDEECWEKTDTIHGIKLNRRVVAKKMVKPQNWRGESNPLDDFYRYQVACWCCLEEEVVALFERFKQERKVKDGDTAALKKLVRLMSGSFGTDHIMEYWSHVVSGYASELKLEGRHLYVYGLNLARPMYGLRVEAVEFFWDRIKSLPEGELSAQQKDEIFVKTAVYASASRCRGHPEVFEFCFSQIDPDKYPELLKRDFAQNGHYGSLSVLRDAFCFDQFQRLFDCLNPRDISEDFYCALLGSVKVEDYLGHYVDAGVRLFMHMWMKERFDSHRALMLKEEMEVNPYFVSQRLLNSLVRKNCMEPVWAILDKASPDQIKEFMGSRQADYIRSVLKERGDENSLNKFLSYGGSTIKELENPNASLSEVDLSEAHEAKRPKMR
ncbi:hypothetical protein [Wolbachia endosymbiont (group A) of Pogonocherus hispidulus]|uniref:hypothetical protein n=1 Tax=Wolbachia endosymbiont (group A) of Pogonocherus hispidulus TaxID=3066136 RepID=UPI00333E6354